LAESTVLNPNEASDSLRKTDFRSPGPMLGVIQSMAHTEWSGDIVLGKIDS
jgi:hypothetical protein